MPASPISALSLAAKKMGGDVQEAVGQGKRWGVDITYIVQDAPLGLAHCVLIAQDFLGDDRFVMFLGDNVIEGGISKLIGDFEDSDYHCQIVLTPVEEPQHYGVAEFNAGSAPSNNWWKSRATRSSNLALVGIYMFDEHVHEAVPRDETLLARRTGNHRRHPVAGGAGLQRPSLTSIADGGSIPASRSICWPPTARCWKNYAQSRWLCRSGFAGR